MNNTTNLGMVLPVVTQTPGPDYASEINADLGLIDEHDHSGPPNGGKQLGANALVIDGNVQMNGFNLGTARSVQCNDNAAVLSGVGDIRCVYFKGGDLYCNNSAGVAIQITSGSAIDVASVNTVLEAATVNANLTIDPAATVSYYEMDSSGGAFTIILPLCAAVGAGRRIYFVDHTASASTHAVRINASGSDTFGGGSHGFVNDSRGGVMVVSDGISAWDTLTQFTAELTVDNLSCTAVNGIAGADITMANNVVCSSSISAANLTVTGTASVGTTPATAGDVRIPKTGTLRARNAANSGNLSLVAVNGSDIITIGDTAAVSLAVTAAGTCTMGPSGAIGITCGATTTTVSGGGTGMIGCQSGKLGFYSTVAASPVSQPTRAGQLTDNTTGTVSSALAALTGVYATDVGLLRNALASLAAKLNALDANQHMLGLSS